MAILRSGIINQPSGYFYDETQRQFQMCLQTLAHPAPCTEYQYMCCVDYFYNYVSVPTGSSVIVNM